VALSVAISAAVTQYIDWLNGRERFALCNDALFRQINKHPAPPENPAASIAWMAHVCGAFLSKRMP
jgi:hypothetical protein